MRSTRRRAITGFAVLLAGVVVLVAATMGLGKPSVPDDAVAFVEDVEGGEITPEEFQTAIAQAAASQGAQGTPEPGDPQYAALKAPAISELLLARWVRGEADERGIEVTEREVDERLEEIIETDFGGRPQFERFLEDSSLTEEGARERVELQILTSCLQDRVVPQDPESPTPPSREGCQGEETVEITDEEIQSFYDENISQFQTPETRDVRTILNPDREKAEEALSRLQEDDSAQSWKQVAQELSTDEATADLGGVRQGVAEGQNEEALDEAIFSAQEGELIGPIEGEAGFYVAQVEQINEAQTQELDPATSDQIRSTLVTQRQQEAVQEFQESFIAKWRSRSVCSKELLEGDQDGSIADQLSQRCANIDPSGADDCAGDDEGEEPQTDPTTGEALTGCGAFVPAFPVIDPTTDSDAPLPQGPQGPPAPDSGLPEDALPLGIPGAGQVPGGAPPGTTPPGAAPPGAAPAP